MSTFVQFRDGFVNDRFTAINDHGEEHDVICPVCTEDKTKMPQCRECAGRGRVDNVPYAERPWDEVIPGLSIGGHMCQPHNAHNIKGDVIVKDEFHLVVTLYDGGIWYGPTGGRILRHTMADAELEAVNHGHIHRLADEVVSAVRGEQRVLVRCWAGLNRSALVLALAMIKMGWEPVDAIAKIREVRSPYALFNPSFVAYLMKQEPAR